MLHIPSLYITHSEGKGRGVFTAAVLQTGDLIEICPLIMIPERDRVAIHNSYLHDYYFLSPPPEPRMCFALGYGSIYNHSELANAAIIFDIPNQQLEIHCIREIAAGSEILIDYTGGLADAPGIWFDPV